MNRVRILAAVGIALASAGGVLVALSMRGGPPAHVVAHVSPLLRVHVRGHASVRSVPAGIACPHTCAAAFARGTPIILKLRAAGSWHVLGWSEDCGRRANCRLTMSSPRTLDV
ncbi:MAG: hypothetical protein QOG85_1196, partial [Gaiellaceae bacterium]|nr:hypothetical protein [Gaiellaceae bacterium]